VLPDRTNNLARMPRGQDPAPEPFFGNFGVAPPLHWDRLSLKEPRVFGGARHDQADRRSQRLSPQDAHTLCSIAADLRRTQVQRRPTRAAEAT
jgi:acetamidase/formamidase